MYTKYTNLWLEACCVARVALLQGTKLECLFAGAWHTDSRTDLMCMQLLHILTCNSNAQHVALLLLTKLSSRHKCTTAEAVKI